MAPQQKRFTVVDIAEVPTPEPVVQVVTEPTGSQWDDALKALAAGDERMAIRVDPQDGQGVRHMMQTLRTIAATRDVWIEVRRGDGCFYAWRVDRVGRFSNPAPCSGCVCPRDGSTCWTCEGVPCAEGA